MSNETAKFLNSKRRHKTDVAIARQKKIAKANGLDCKEPHKFAKHRAMNCGNPKCMLCSNPRKTFKKLTAQEQRLFQDVEKTSDRHSNGLNNDQEDIL